MKKPYSKLPYRTRINVDNGIDIVNHSTPIAEVYLKENADYITEACNNYHEIANLVANSNYNNDYLINKIKEIIL